MSSGVSVKFIKQCAMETLLLVAIVPLMVSLTIILKGDIVAQ